VLSNPGDAIGVAVVLPENFYPSYLIYTLRFFFDEKGIIAYDGKRKISNVTALGFDFL
jgi:hypothetical protein